MDDSLPLNICYFAWVAERIGLREEQCPGTMRRLSIAGFIAARAAGSAAHAAAFSRPDRLRAALDQRFVPLDTIIGDARELAIFPPVTGG